jgi:uncharacterized protein YcaQ
MENVSLRHYRLNKTLADSDIPLPRAVIMAPLDNLLWDRRFVEELFDFYLGLTHSKDPKGFTKRFSP